MITQTESTIDNTDYPQIQIIQAAPVLDVREQLQAVLPQLSVCLSRFIVGIDELKRQARTGNPDDLFLLEAYQEIAASVKGLFDGFPQSTLLRN